jgi:hypothetical protein
VKKLLFVVIAISSFCLTIGSPLPSILMLKDKSECIKLIVAPRRFKLVGNGPSTSTISEEFLIGFNLKTFRSFFTTGV